MIDLKTLRELVRLMAANELTELDIQDQNERVTLKRRGGEAASALAPAAPHAPLATAPPPAGASPTATAAAPPSGAAAGGGDAGLVPVASPMVGTFYAAASPDAKPFVAVGDRVTPDTVVCIIEAMKVFNEIKPEVSGVVEKVLASSGQAVEYGQPLLLLRPA